MIKKYLTQLKDHYNNYIVKKNIDKSFLNDNYFQLYKKCREYIINL